MPTEVSYSYARQNFADLLNEAAEAQEPVIIKRRGREDMALLPANELRSLEETAHLLRSPKNARRLLTALQRALDGSIAAQTSSELKRDVGL
jgi:antitoxin YefM